MATIRVPVVLENPRTASLAGNCWWAPLALTDGDFGLWHFKQDVQGKAYGRVALPKNLAGTPNAKLVLALAANATTGVTRMQIGTKAIADGESLNPTLTDETAIDTTVPGTAYLRKDVTFPASGSLGETVAADDLLLVEIFHDGTHANDTLAANTLLAGAWLQCDVS